MATRSLNYTQRQRILRAHTSLQVHTRNGHVPTFDAALDLSPYALPADALVYIEAYRRTQYMRFRLGPVGSLRPVAGWVLTEFPDVDGLKFRVKVTAAVGPAGILLAEADRLAPGMPEQDEVRREPLLPVRADEGLGSEVYRLVLEDGEWELRMNADLRDWRAIALRPVFVALVYPACLRSILTRAYDESSPDPWCDDDPDCWQARWKRFATSELGAGEPPAEREDGIEWIEDAVRRFSDRHHLFKLFADACEGAEL